jgi:hypothetical protein
MPAIAGSSNANPTSGKYKCLLIGAKGAKTGMIRVNTIHKKQDITRGRCRNLARNTTTNTAAMIIDNIIAQITNPWLYIKLLNQERSIGEIKSLR